MYSANMLFLSVSPEGLLGLKNNLVNRTHLYVVHVLICVQFKCTYICHSNRLYLQHKIPGCFQDKCF